MSERKADLDALAEGKQPSVFEPFVQSFARLMVQEMEANSGKGGWSDDSPDSLMAQVWWHSAKLAIAIKEQDPDRIAEYAADTANMAAMVADVCGVLP